MTTSDSAASSSVVVAGFGGRGVGSRGGDGDRKGWMGWGLLWVGRGIATILAIFWGVFFLEHLSEWYVNRGTTAYPPPWVTVAMIAHFGMIVGLLGMVRWRVLGAAITVASTAAFFYPTFVGGKPAWLVLINLVPVALITVSWLVRARER